MKSLEDFHASFRVDFSTFPSEFPSKFSTNFHQTFARVSTQTLSRISTRFRPIASESPHLLQFKTKQHFHVFNKFIFFSPLFIGYLTLSEPQFPSQTRKNHSPSQTQDKMFNLVEVGHQFGRKFMHSSSFYLCRTNMNTHF
jgi:hypothetical protein